MHRERPGVVYNGGNVMPFESTSFDKMVCTEVLERSEDPELLVAEISRVVRPGCTRLPTVPWFTKLHDRRHDYHRFTCARFLALFRCTGFGNIEICEPENVGDIANKLTVLKSDLSAPAGHGTSSGEYPLESCATDSCGICCGGTLFRCTRQGLQRRPAWMLLASYTKPRLEIHWIHPLAAKNLWSADALHEVDYAPVAGT